MSKANIFIFKRNGKYFYIVGTKKQALAWAEWYTSTNAKRPRKIAVIACRNALLSAAYEVWAETNGHEDYFTTYDFDAALTFAWDAYHR